MTKIEKLTPEQESQLPIYRDKWIKIGLSCDPCNFEEAKKYAKMAYEAADLKPPKKFYVVKSPIAAVDLIAGMDDKDTSRNDIFSQMMYGSHDAGWLSFYDFMLNEVKIDCSKIEGLIGIAKNCGWWNAYEEFAVFQDRHSELHLNEEGEIHCETGPAIKYSDGFGIYGLNGVRLTEQIVMAPETLTLEQINSESNQDVRSIMIDRFTWERYITDSNAECLDIRKNEVENTMEALYNLGRDGNRLAVTCPTSRMFALGVPSEIKTCEEAQDWLGSDENMKYNVIGRT